MSDGGSPDGSPEIPQDLIDSVTSVAAYEQQERRAFQIGDYAWKLQIPKESMAANETVRRYMSVLRDADAARERLVRSEAMDPVIPRESPLRVQTNAAARLYAAEKMILEEGFQHVM